MEGYSKGEVTSAEEWGAHIAAHQAEGVAWDPLTGYSDEQLKTNANYAATDGNGAASEVVESEEHKPGEREFGPATRHLTAAQIVNLGKPVVHSTGEQPTGDDSVTHHVPGRIIDEA